MATEEKKDKKVKRPTAQKRVLQSEKRRLGNKSYRSTIRSAVRKFQESLTKGDSATSKQYLNEVYSLVDKGVKKGILKINTASRTKSRLTAQAAKAKA
jgi:small subunit ribosomal protein S20